MTPGAAQPSLLELAKVEIECEQVTNRVGVLAAIETSDQRPAGIRVRRGRAIELALKPGVRGIFNVAGPDPLPLSRIVKMLDRPSIAVPYTFGRAVLKQLWQLRLTTFPVPELDHIRFVCMVDDQRARRVLGFKPACGIEETVRSIDDGAW